MKKYKYITLSKLERYALETVVEYLLDDGDGVKSKWVEVIEGLLKRSRHEE